MTQCIELFFEYDSKNWTLFKNTTQRIELFFFRKKKTQNWIFWEKWLKELNLFFNTTQRIDPFLLVYDANNWTLFQYDSKNWIWLKGLNLFFCFNLTERIVFFHMTQRIEPFLKNDLKNWTFFSVWLKELNPFVKYESQNWTF